VSINIVLSLQIYIAQLTHQPEALPLRENKAVLK